MDKITDMVRENALRKAPQTDAATPAKKEKAKKDKKGGAVASDPTPLEV